MAVSEVHLLQNALFLTTVPSISLEQILFVNASAPARQATFFASTHLNVEPHVILELALRTHAVHFSACRPEAGMPANSSGNGTSAGSRCADKLNMCRVQQGLARFEQWNFRGRCAHKLNMCEVQQGLARFESVLETISASFV